MVLALEAEVRLLQGHDQPGLYCPRAARVTELGQVKHSTTTLNKRKPYLALFSPFSSETETVSRTLYL